MSQDTFASHVRRSRADHVAETLEDFLGACEGLERNDKLGGYPPSQHPWTLAYEAVCESATAKKVGTQTASLWLDVLNIGRGIAQRTVSEAKRTASNSGGDSETGGSRKSGPDPLKTPHINPVNQERAASKPESVKPVNVSSSDPRKSEEVRAFIARLLASKAASTRPTPVGHMGADQAGYWARELDRSRSFLEGVSLEGDAVTFRVSANSPWVRGGADIRLTLTPSTAAHVRRLLERDRVGKRRDRQTHDAGQIAAVVNALAPYVVLPATRSTFRHARLRGNVLTLLRAHGERGLVLTLSEETAAKVELALTRPAPSPPLATVPGPASSTFTLHSGPAPSLGIPAKTWNDPAVARRDNTVGASTWANEWLAPRTVPALSPKGLAEIAAEVERIAKLSVSEARAELARGVQGPVETGRLVSTEPEAIKAAASALSGYVGGLGFTASTLLLGTGWTSVSVEHLGAVGLITFHDSTAHQAPVAFALSSSAERLLRAKIKEGNESAARRRNVLTATEPEAIKAALDALGVSFSPGALAPLAGTWDRVTVEGVGSSCGAVTFHRANKRPVAIALTDATEQKVRAAIREALAEFHKSPEAS